MAAVWVRVFNIGDISEAHYTLCVSMKVFNYIVVGLLTFTASLAVIVALRPPEQSGFPVKPSFLPACC